VSQFDEKFVKGFGLGSIYTNLVVTIVVAYEPMLMVIVLV